MKIHEKKTHINVKRDAAILEFFYELYRNLATEFFYWINNKLFITSSNSWNFYKENNDHDDTIINYKNIWPFTFYTKFIYKISRKIINFPVPSVKLLNFIWGWIQCASTHAPNNTNKCSHFPLPQDCAILYIWAFTLPPKFLQQYTL